MFDLIKNVRTNAKFSQLLIRAILVPILSHLLVKRVGCLFQRWGSEFGLLGGRGGLSFRRRGGRGVQTWGWWRRRTRPSLGREWESWIGSLTVREKTDWMDEADVELFSPLCCCRSCCGPLCLSPCLPSFHCCPSYLALCPSRFVSLCCGRLSDFLLWCTDQCPPLFSLEQIKIISNFDIKVLYLFSIAMSYVSLKLSFTSRF